MSQTILRLYDGYQNHPELNSQVKELQQKLLNKGYSVDTDGKFGPGTERAVKQFQQDNNLTADGVAGNDTYAALNQFVVSTPTPTLTEGVLTVENLKIIAPHVKVINLNRYTSPLNSITKTYEINTALRLAHFIAQVGHESNSFNSDTENLNYGAPGLRNTFSRYFTTDELAMQYKRKPEMIANRVYANRLGNGDEASGDGWKYRGRGLIQLTGKENYQKFSNTVTEDIVNTPDLLASDSTLAVKAACWFWNSRNLNRYADEDDVRQITKRINGGYNGLDDRIEFLKRAKHTFGI